MTTVELLLNHVSLVDDGAFRAHGGRFSLEVVTGRPGSVCFTLQEETERGVRVTLAEGFSLKNQILYDKRSLPASQIERIIRELTSPADAGVVAAASLAEADLVGAA